MQVLPKCDLSPILRWFRQSSYLHCLHPRPQQWLKSPPGPHLPLQVKSSNTHRFLAAPKPPGKMAASWLAALSWARSVILPRAILADSARTFLGKSTKKPRKGSAQVGEWQVGAHKTRGHVFSAPGSTLTHAFHVNTQKRQLKLQGRKRLLDPSDEHFTAHPGHREPPASVRGPQQGTPQVSEADSIYVEPMGRAAVGKLGSSCPR